MWGTTVIALASLMVERTVETCVALVLLLLASLFALRRKADEPPSIPDLIPYVSNTWQYLTHIEGLIRQARRCFGRGNIVKFHLGTKTVYIVKGRKNVQRLLAHSPDLGSEGFVLQVMKGLFTLTPEDLAKYVNDKSGRMKAPNPGTESTPKRYWAETHDLYHDYLTRTRDANALSERYYSLFDKRLGAQPLGEWATVHIRDFIKRHLTECAVVTLNGSRMMDINPDFCDLYWDFDQYGIMLIYMPPRWLARKAYKAQERCYAAVRRYLESAWDNFDWSDTAEVQSDWDPHFGSRFARELAKWLRDGGFSMQSATGFFSSVIFGLNANGVPLATWALMHLLQDPPLLAAARKEATETVQVDPASGVRTINLAKLLSMPLLQAIFAETLRLHVAVTLSREIHNPVVFEGHTIPRGAYIQAFTGISHVEEETWGRQGHPASDFWPGRHLVTTTTRDANGEVCTKQEFSLAGKTGAYFPFGGGTGVCPGRYFAKQEILVTIAAILARFEIEFVEWTHLSDGTRSEREAMNDEHYGGATMHPDRDARIRWRRLW